MSTILKDNGGVVIDATTQRIVEPEQPKLTLVPTKAVVTAMKRIKLTDTRRREYGYNGSYHPKRDLKSMYGQSLQKKSEKQKVMKRAEVAELIKKAAYEQLPKEIVKVATNPQLAKFLNYDYAVLWIEPAQLTPLINAAIEADPHGNYTYNAGLSVVRKAGGEIEAYTKRTGTPIPLMNADWNTRSCDSYRPFYVKLNTNTMTVRKLLKDFLVATEQTAEWVLLMKNFSQMVDACKTLWDLYQVWPEMAQEYCKLADVTLPTNENVEAVEKAAAEQKQQALVANAMPAEHFIEQLARLSGIKRSQPVTIAEEVKAAKKVK